VGPMDCVTVHVWAASLVRRRGLKRTNGQERSNSFQGEVSGEGGPRATEGSTGVCRRHTLTMTNGPGPTARVDTVDPPVDTVDPTPRIGSTLSTVPNCSGRHRRPATVLGSTPPTRTCSRLAAVALSTALGSTPSVLPHPRVDAVDPPVPTGGSQSGVRVGVNRETRFEKQVTFENAKEAGV
jgi:hypothetical protein